MCPGRSFLKEARRQACLPYPCERKLSPRFRGLQGVKSKGTIEVWVLLLPSGRWILAATTLASSTAFLLGAAVNIALPSIQSYFGSSIAGIEWVANSQLLFLATLLLIGGSLGDYFGRKRIFIMGIWFLAWPILPPD